MDLLTDPEDTERQRAARPVAQVYGFASVTCNTSFADSDISICSTSGVDNRYNVRKPSLSHFYMIAESPSSDKSMPDVHAKWHVQQVLLHSPAQHSFCIFQVEEQTSLASPEARGLKHSSSGEQVYLFERDF